MKIVELLKNTKSRVEAFLSEEGHLNRDPSMQTWKSELRRVLVSKMTRKVCLIVIALIVLRVGYNYLMRDRFEEVVPFVHVVQVKTDALDLSLTLPGNMEALEQASIYAHVSGYLKKIFVDEGHTVKKDESLADIEAPDIVNEYTKFKSAYDFQAVTRKRYKELLDDQVISQQEFDAVDSSYAEAKARYDGAAAEMAYTHIRAPFAGSVARRYKMPGDLISLGKSDQVPIFLLVNESRLRVVVNVSQSDLAHVKKGSPVDIRVDTFPGEKFSGTITGLDDLLDAGSKTQRALIDIDNPDGKLHAGMFATVVIHFEHKDSAMTVPVDALDHQGDKTSLYILKDGKAQKRDISVGLRDGERIEVTSGLSAGDLVILKGTQALRDGEKVQALEAGGSSAK